MYGCVGWQPAKMGGARIGSREQESGQAGVAVGTAGIFKNSNNCHVALALPAGTKRRVFRTPETSTYLNKQTGSERSLVEQASGALVQVERAIFLACVLSWAFFSGNKSAMGCLPGIHRREPTSYAVIHAMM